MPTKVLLSRADRLFPAEFVRRVVRERLGIVPDEMDGGHLVALSRPRELADRLDSYARDSPAPVPGRSGAPGGHHRSLKLTRPRAPRSRTAYFGNR